MPESTYSPKEVALQLGFCTKTVLKIVKRGQIYPIYRINARVIRIPESSVQAYLRRCRELDILTPGQRE